MVLSLCLGSIRKQCVSLVGGGFFIMGLFSAVKIIEVNYKSPAKTELKRVPEKPLQP